MTVVPAESPPWPGAWLSEHLPATLSGTARTTVGLALRRNPNRAHLLVSRLLGKHVPVEPRRVLDAGHRLGRLVRGQMGTWGVNVPPLVIGYAETATALGQCVADSLPDAPYLHSTRRPPVRIAPAAAFAEEHSHATGHLLVPADPALLVHDGPVVLVDDEISTGRTAANTIRALHALHRRTHYLVATLVHAAGGDTFGDLAAELGVTIATVATTRARLRLPSDAPARAALLARRHGEPPRQPDRDPAVTHLRLQWPAGLPESARHGYHPADRARWECELPGFVRRIPHVPRLLVLGTEELMYTPLRLADALAARGSSVLFASTTRSPAVAIDRPGYPIRNALEFDALDEEGLRFAYNVAGLAVDAVLLVVDPAAEHDRLTAANGLLPALAAVSDRVLVVTAGDTAS